MTAATFKTVKLEGPPRNIENQLFTSQKTHYVFITNRSVKHADLRKVVYTYLTFIGPCIVIHYYSKTNQCTSFSNDLFLHDTLHISDGLSVHHQEFKTVRTATGIRQICALKSTAYLSKFSETCGNVVFVTSFNNLGRLNEGRGWGVGGGRNIAAILDATRIRTE
jgi:hypothetical protein